VTVEPYNRYEFSLLALTKICRLRLGVMERLPTTLLCIAMEIWNSVKSQKQIAGFGILKGLSLIMTISSSTVYKFLKYTNFMLCTNFLATWKTMRMNSYRKSRPLRDRKRDRSVHCQASACVMYLLHYSVCVMQSSKCSRHHVVHCLRVLQLDCKCNQIETWMFDRESCLASREQLYSIGRTHCLHTTYCCKFCKHRIINMYGNINCVVHRCLCNVQLLRRLRVWGSLLFGSCKRRRIGMDG